MADGTPLMEQYRKIKSEYQSEILFFRLEIGRAHV